MIESETKRELIFLTLQFLRDEQRHESLHKLESESGVFFDMSYFGEILIKGKFEEAEEYLSGFTKFDENRHSIKLFFEIRKQKYYEALDRKDYAEALEILDKELKVFSTENKEVFEGLTYFLTFDNIREHKLIYIHGDIKEGRDYLVANTKSLIENNPVFRNKLEFPTIEKSRLRTLIDQSFKIQHYNCKYPLADPKLETLYEDHTCNFENACGVVRDAYKTSWDQHNQSLNFWENLCKNLVHSEMRTLNNNLTSPQPGAFGNDGNVHDTTCYQHNQSFKVQLKLMENQKSPDPEMGTLNENYKWEQLNADKVTKKGKGKEKVEEVQKTSSASGVDNMLKFI